MNIDLRKLCRICFVDNADVDITQHKVVTAGQTNEAESEEEEHTICEIMEAMFVGFEWHKEEYIYIKLCLHIYCLNPAAHLTGSILWATHDMPSMPRGEFGPFCIL